MIIATVYNRDVIDTVISIVTRYRRLPALGDKAAGWGVVSDRGKEKHCDRNEGHVLTLQDGQIVCTRCPAIWRDFGY